jgi:hypothetical protein
MRNFPYKRNGELRWIPGMRNGEQKRIPGMRKNKEKRPNLVGPPLLCILFAITAVKPH